MAENGRKRQALVEVKGIERLAPIHDAQLLSHLRVGGKSVGLIINFPLRLLTRSTVSKKAENSSDL
jgi:GxxExxY protein